MILMHNVARWILAGLLVVHGLIHFLGAAKGFGWALVPQLHEPISALAGAVWLLAGALVCAVAAMTATSAPSWWWVTALLAALVSQVALITSWHDAKAGTAVNVILLVVGTCGFLMTGPFSLSTQWSAHVDAALAQPAPAAPPILTPADLTALPVPLAGYIERSGAIGGPRTTCFSADIHGRIRSAPDKAWMSFTGKQLNTLGENPQRLFLMHARRSGVPVEVLHRFGDATATMQVKLLSAIPLVDAKGPDMDRAETVTVFNELVIFAPDALVGAPVRWTEVDDHHVHGVYTLGQHSVSAMLTFDDHHDLVNFVSPDRSTISDLGTSTAPQEWSTPLLEHRESNGRRVATVGEARWRSPESEHSFTYLEITFDAISFNVGGPDRKPPGTPSVSLVGHPAVPTS